MDSNHDFSHFTIAVIGLGLMGGSFAKRFKAIGSRVIGINRTASVAQEALRMGIVDSISEEDLKDADIVIFCTPEKGTMSLFSWLPTSEFSVTLVSSNALILLPSLVSIIYFVLGLRME